MSNLENIFVKNFQEFLEPLNEGFSLKKDRGVIGPFRDWGYKIKGCCSEQGGKPSGSEILISDSEHNPDDYCLKYYYGENKVSDPIYVPKHSFLVSGSPDYPVLQTRPKVRWWDDEKNQEDFDDFIDSYIESTYFKDSEEDISGDAQFFLDLIDHEASITECQKKKENHWAVKLADGGELIWKKKDKDNFLNALKYYLSPDSYHPEIEITKDSPGFEILYSTPRGKFARKIGKISDISRDPIHQYLLNSSLKRDVSLYQEPVLNYLQSVLKSQDWRPREKRDFNSFSEKEKEINQLKKILSNSLSESDLDGIYSKAREMYSKDPSSKETR